MAIDDNTNVTPAIKIDKWDGNAVKNALDDHVMHVFVNQLNYVQSHKLMNIRLLICIMSVSAALFALVWDYLYPFPLSKQVITICVIAYFISMTILTLYSTYIEKGIFLIACKNNKRWFVSSELKRYDDIYHLIFEFYEGKEYRTLKFSSSVSNWFDEDGYLVTSKFESDIINNHNSLLKSKKVK